MGCCGICTAAPALLLWCICLVYVPNVTAPTPLPRCVPLLPVEHTFLPHLLPCSPPTQPCYGTGVAPTVWQVGRRAALLPPARYLVPAFGCHTLPVADVRCADAPVVPGSCVPSLDAAHPRWLLCRTVGWFGRWFRFARHVGYNRQATLTSETDLALCHAVRLLFRIPL